MTTPISQGALQGPPITSSVAVTAPGTIAASGTIDLGLQPAYGMPHLALSAELTNAGTVVVTRFLDGGGVVQVGSTAIAMTAGTIALGDINDGKVFQSFDVKIVNGGTTAATLTNVNIVQSAK